MAESYYNYPKIFYIFVVLNRNNYVENCKTDI